MALRDMGTLIMLASSRMASLALLCLSLSAVVVALSCSIGVFSFPTTILILRVTTWTLYSVRTGTNGVKEDHETLF